MPDDGRDRVSTDVHDAHPLVSTPRVMTDGGVSGEPLFDSFPDPLIAYANVADASVVRSVNPAFEATFDLEPDVETGGLTIEHLLAEQIGVRLDPSGGIDSTAETTDGAILDEPTEVPVTEKAVGDLLDRLRSASTSSVVVCIGTEREPRYFRLRHVTATERERVLVFTEITAERRRETELETTVQRLKRITSIAAHDLRNPIEVATIRLEAVRETGDESHLENVEIALDRIQRIVDDVLSVGSQRSDPVETVPLGDVAQAAWSTVETADATLSVGQDLPSVRGGVDRLQRLFENLFRNSVRHGGRDVGVSICRLRGGFYVADDGPGIRSEARERVFDPGYSTTDGSSGLGLAIVEQIAAEHGWDVTLAADVDGTRFEFSGVSTANPEE